MEWVAYDTETTGTQPYLGDTMFSYSLCDDAGEPSVHRLDGSRVRGLGNMNRLRSLWLNSGTRIAKVMHNAKFDMTVTENILGTPLPPSTQIHDTAIMCRLLRSKLYSYKLKDILWLLAGYPVDDEKLVKRHAAGLGGDYSLIPESVMDHYQEGDAERTALLFQFLSQKMREAPQGIRNVYEWERRLIWTTKRMERRGIRISEKRVRKLARKLKRQALDIRDQIEEMAGRPVNPFGPQAGHLLYNILGLPVTKLTGTGKPSTDKDVLLEMRDLHPAVNLILQYRSYARGRTAIQSYVDLSDEEGYIHPSINTCGARPGRESCSEPNVQNVETTDTLRNPYPVPARSVFITRPGYVTFLIDESGIELRILVHYSGDPIMTEAFMNGEDPHQIPAREIWYRDWWSTASDELRLLWRNATKNGNFAIHYGASIPKVAGTLLLPRELVRSRWEEYHERFPGARTLQAKVKEQVLRDGYITTAFGRRVYVPRHKPYMGVNYIGQGTAADIIKIAQVRVDDYLDHQTNDEVGLQFPVHDELVGECPFGRWSQFRKKELPEVLHLMTDFPEMRIPLEAGVEVTATDWEHTEKLRF